VREDSWTVQVYLGLDAATGRKRYRSEAVRGTRVDAERRLTEILREMDLGSPLPSSRGLTVSDFLEGWLRDPMESRVRGKTLEGYCYHVRCNIVPRIGGVFLERLTPGRVQDMESELLRSGGREGLGLSAQTVLHAHRVLFSALSHAVQLGLVSRNAVASVTPPRARRYEGRTLSWKEAWELLSGVRNPLFRSVFLLALHTGLRRSELLGLQWRDVDLPGASLAVRRGLVKLSSGRLEVREPKSGRGRMIPLTEESVRCLESHRDRRPGNGGFVFCHSDGSPLNPVGVSRAFHRVVLEAGLEGVRFHDLRHTHASLLLSQGVHLKVVSERLGHSSVAITGDIYAHVLPTVQRDAVERFGSAWGSAGAG
jgi:integrase